MINTKEEAFKAITTVHTVINNQTVKGIEACAGIINAHVALNELVEYIKNIGDKESEKGDKVSAVNG